MQAVVATPSLRDVRYYQRTAGLRRSPYPEATPATHHAWGRSNAPPGLASSL